MHTHPAGRNKPITKGRSKTNDSYGTWDDFNNILYGASRAFYSQAMTILVYGSCMGYNNKQRLPMAAFQKHCG